MVKLRGLQFYLLNGTVLRHVYKRVRERGGGGLAGEDCLSVYKTLEETKTRIKSAHHNEDVFVVL